MKVFPSIVFLTAFPFSAFIHCLFVSVGGRYKKTPLFWSCWNGRLKCAQLLVQHGAGVNLADKYGGTPLMEASLEGRGECVGR